MNIYSIVLLLHIAGAIGFFVVQGVEWIGLSQIRSAQLSEDARAIMGLVKRTNRLAFVSMLTAVTTGIYMMLTVWRFVPWILVALGSLILEMSPRAGGLRGLLRLRGRAVDAGGAAPLRAHRLDRRDVRPFGRDGHRPRRRVGVREEAVERQMQAGELRHARGVRPPGLGQRAGEISFFGDDVGRAVA